MADCSSIVLTGILVDCTPSAGGIKRVWLAPYVAGMATAGTDGKISAITDKTAFKEYQFRRGTGSLSSELTADETTGINYVTNNLELVFTKMETAKRIEMVNIAVGHVCAIVEDANGHQWFLGKDDYVAPSAGAGNTGTAKGDQNAYTLTLTSEELEFPMELADDIKMA